MLPGDGFDPLFSRPRCGETKLEVLTARERELHRIDVFRHGQQVRRDGQLLRLKVRTASFSNLSVLPWLLEGALVPDIIAILGSLDFVLGDVDR